MGPAFTVGLSFLLGVGVTDSLSAGANLRFGVQYDWLDFGLEARATLPEPVVARARLDPAYPASPREFDASEVSVLFAPCVRFAAYFAGCPIARAGAVFATVPMQKVTTLVSASFGARFMVERGLNETFAAFAFVEGLFGPGVTYAPRDPGPGDQVVPNVVWQQSPAAGHIAAGVLARFE